MKKNGLRAKSWRQRSCGVGEDWERGLLGLAGDMVDVSYVDILVVLYISYSKVKEIMKELQREFQNGNARVESRLERCLLVRFQSMSGMTMLQQQSRDTA
jgi:hypothetical protein